MEQSPPGRRGTWGEVRRIPCPFLWPFVTGIDDSFHFRVVFGACTGEERGPCGPRSFFALVLPGFFGTAEAVPCYKARPLLAL